MARINIFQNIPLVQDVSVETISGIGFLRFNEVFIPGSISFNTVGVIYSASGTTAKTLSLSFGLYSVNGASLSLANSASGSINPGANALSWLTLATSATQDITPGSWFFALMSSTAGQSNLSVIIQSRGGLVNVTYGGPFFRGQVSASTGAMPASVATSDLQKEPWSTNCTGVPYILISA